ncbi:MAG: polyribonucleotide nucleotidyltransferase [Deltaproteobacteria bacterium]|jgi:polyribonucleotide nucleotidyltransferase|nr:polyribonucleotide nucleotidyltransferase [Deltaproteobacteria bacterium]MBT6433892.1 polyribonucleotide nucleotidyltransferase [Deltaproteobacteria bacterium]MBT6489511.1 polyribonucleotide nucleotidyltransferase [Deltaproteobacteria bacterium]
MTMVEKQVQVGETTITVQTGKVAKQASGSVMISAGGTTVLVTAVGSKDARPDIDFLPLTVDYQEKMSAAGKIPGGFFKREGRLRENETLTSRIIDRSIRPLFADGWQSETQIIATVFSADAEHPADALALIGASTALHISDLPFLGPIAGIRVCRIDGNLVANPSHEAQQDADINLFVASSKDAIMMVEGGADEASESDIIDALLFAHEQAQAVIAMQNELREACGKEKRVVTPAVVDADLAAKVADLATQSVTDAYSVKEKIARYAALDAAKKDLVAKLVEQDETMAARKGEISSIFGDLKYNLVRKKMVAENVRIDGRGPADVRGISTETTILERTHGSALFTRGETQSIVTCTLGTKQDEQRVDGLLGDSFENFMLHYNFPPYSVGEARFMRGPGRREIGHGSLAHRALKKLVQFGEDFPYTIRILSDITESNGSSSMATVCGGSMSMMDAGVPMKAACAGIAMGLIQEGDKMMILSDILGDEDHLGDMDFKVAGTAEGITAIQMDIKITGVTREVMETALTQAREGRLHILEEMAKTLGDTREEMSNFAPRITSFKISQDRIRDVIGPGGKVIKDIIARTGCQVNIDDDGTVNVASADGESASRAVKMIRDLTQEAEVGKLYLGNVRKVTDFGAFIEIFPGTDGLCHISELADRRVKQVEDVVQEGDEVLVKCIGVEKGRIRLSRKEAIADEKKRKEEEADAPAEEAEAPAETEA